MNASKVYIYWRCLSTLLFFAHQMVNSLFLQGFCSWNYPFVIGEKWWKECFGMLKTTKQKQLLEFCPAFIYQHILTFSAGRKRSFHISHSCCCSLFPSHCKGSIYLPPLITAWILRVALRPGVSSSICCSTNLLSEIWLGWTERAPAVTTASLWLAFANQSESMKCAEDVTLAPILFINEMLCKLISHRRPRTLPRNMLALHKKLLQLTSHWL